MASDSSRLPALSLLLRSLPLWPLWLWPLLSVSALSAQEEGAPEILGQPAEWSVEPSQAPTLIPIPSGSSLRAEPTADAALLSILPDAKLELLESRQPWVRVRYGEMTGWVDLEAPRSSQNRDEEPMPLQPRFEAGTIEPNGELGAYTFWGLIRDRAVRAYLDRVATDHARLYAERYGLLIEEPVGGDVVYFTRRSTFVLYSREQGHDIDIQGNGYFKAPALVVMHTGRGHRRQIAATLVHELTHLLNWHLLGGWRRGRAALAPWLDEGMADDMAFASSDRSGQLRAEPLGPSNLRYGGRLGARLLELDRAIEKGLLPSIPQLLDMDSAAFLDGPIAMHYTLSALWIRYLLSDPELAERFRAFLPLVARGGAADATNLGAHLGREWPELERGFRAWRRKQQLRF